MRLLIAVVAALTCALAAGAASAQPVAGDWLGTLTVSPVETLRIAVHIKKTAAGGYAGTFDSLDRASYGLPLTDVTATAGTLSFTAPIKAAPATYTAQWDATAGAWNGQWKQSGQSLALMLAPGAAAPTPPVADLDGAWDGVLAVGAVQLHLTLHVKSGAAGTAAWMDSVDQLAYGLDVKALHRAGDEVSFEQPALRAAYKGALSADGRSLAGQYTQAGKTLALTFIRRAAGSGGAEALNRPQTPKPPYPYRSEDVAFDDAAAHVRLAGTLTLPQGSGPYPAVVLVSGSGPNGRNEEVARHQVFLVLADYLTRHGIAVLRYDKRGIGQSTGDYAKATTMDFADDAEAAAAFLRGRPEIDPRRVGLLGHSEGGLIVPIVATRDPKVAFIVMMAGPGVDGLDISMEQDRLIAKAMGVTDAEVAKSQILQRQLFDIVRTEKDPQRDAAKLKTALDAYAKAHGLPEASVEAQAGEFNSDWFRFFFDYDPAPTLAKVRCPVLALIGSKDLQVPADQNLPPIRVALAHNPDAEVDELPDLNHLFQTARTGSPGEYAQIEETIAPSALEKITTWIQRHTSPPPHG